MQWLQRIEDDPRTERVVMVLIVINAIVLGLETSPAVTEFWGPALRAVDRAILAVFVVEILARIVVRGRSFFRDPWSVFDFAVVAISLAPASQAFSVLRALRILRVLRLISAVPSLRRVVAGLISALPGMGSVVALLALIFYVFAVMATKLFGAEFPEMFGSIGASIFSLFQIMTLDAWSSEIARPVMEKHPFAWAFFIPYVVVTAFAVLNLFIGIVVNAMQAEHEREMASEREAERDMIHAETAPLAGEVRRLQAEIEALRQDILARLPAPTK